MSLLIGITLTVIGMILLYALMLRKWLVKQPWAQRFFAWIEPVEIALFKKSETVLVGRTVWLGGAIVTAYDGFLAYFSSLNFEPLTTRAMDFLHIPADMRSLTLSAVVTGLGLAIVRLRKTTTKPLELVSAPQATMSFGTKMAMKDAETAKDEAVRAVAEAKP